MYICIYVYSCSVSQVVETTSASWYIWCQHAFNWRKFRLVQEICATNGNLTCAICHMISNAPGGSTLDDSRAFKCR